MAENALTQYPVWKPDPLTVCGGRCGGVGCYPVEYSNENLTPYELTKWLEAHRAPRAHFGEVDGECDGWHVIKCLHCNGTGRMPELVAPPTP